MSRLEPITDPARFATVVEELRGEHVVALDTEFHRERTYYPRIALVQLAWRDEVAIVDPLAVDLAPLAEILDAEGTTTVVHAASQDLEVLLRCCGTVPRQLFDTQIAAGFLGMSNPSLGSLVEREVGVRLPKGDRLTDWLQRPLTDAQLAYAASDVAHLVEIHGRQVAALEARGRLGWALDECDALRNRARVNRPPDEAWSRIKEVRQLRGRARAIARAVAAWRERRAMEVDQPVRFVLADLAIVAIAQRAPTTPDELRSIRGVDDRHAKGEVARQILEAVAEGAAAGPAPAEPTTNGELSRELRPAVGLVSSWVSQLAREEDIDTALLATRADLEALLRGDEDARLAQGWRAELVGEPIRRLVAGEAALAFDGKGGLVLEVRSHLPLRGAPQG
ncbi:ribonuclease D [Actinomarinicola tropica]|uniref:ribonuclease D n=1 Tax=Actinomarinicola tropica TaxID=2789776 RepID=UPI00189B5FAA|nr:ribonuclease D [Actinomarinicola tropica]